MNEAGGYGQITYPRLRELLDAGAQLVEVLPEEDYAELHLPGAMNIPLRAMNASSTNALDRRSAVVTYCWDSVCDLSARAAGRLATLGFDEVYDYGPSKVDWMSRGLELEGERASERRAIHFSGRDVVTCRLEDEVGPLRDRVERSPYRFALVLGPDDVVLGRVPHDALSGDPALRAEQVMHAGPKTYRPNEAPDKLLESLGERRLTAAILTDPDGRLVGVVARSELEARG